MKFYNSNESKNKDQVFLNILLSARCHYNVLSDLSSINLLSNEFIMRLRIIKYEILVRWPYSHSKLT